MKSYIHSFIDVLLDTANKDNLDLNVLKCIDIIKKAKEKNKKIIFVGNGGSASVASHGATDYCNKGGIKTIVLTDPSLLTCVSNDYGYKNAFPKLIKLYGEKEDIVFCISSSGMSKNILDTAKQAVKNGCTVITLSGFDSNNKLRRLGHVNFYVNSHAYGFVELIHNIIVHYIIDIFCQNEKREIRKKI